MREVGKSPTILVAKEGIEKTASVTPDGLYEFLRVPFSLKK